MVANRGRPTAHTSMPAGKWLEVQHALTYLTGFEPRVVCQSGRRMVLTFRCQRTLSSLAPRLRKAPSGANSC